MNLVQLLSGKKTYFTGLIVIIGLIGSWQHWWTLPPEIYAAMMTLALMFLRAGVSKGSTQPTDATPPGGKGLFGSPLVGMFAILTLGILAFSGCVAIAPGADPLVVNVERSETIARGSFDLVLNLDNSDRGFWRTNAPAFHQFCEWLRQPQTVADADGTNTLPRGLAMIMSVDDIKNDYEASRRSSNALLEALATLQSAANQASSWSTIITNKSP